MVFLLYSSLSTLGLMIPIPVPAVSSDEPTKCDGVLGF